MPLVPIETQHNDVQSEHPQHVLDLPQLYEKPSAAVLLATLSLFEIKPRVWKRRTHSSIRTPKLDIKGLSQYLTSIIASPLLWISNDEEREKIWDAAGSRLSERSGRCAAKSMDRTFEISRGDNCIRLIIHEPSLISDNLGCKTWAASYVLANRLANMQFAPGTRTLELGSGTGLVGLTAAAILGIDVILTDLAEIEPNLRRNVDYNSDVIKLGQGRARSAILDWESPQMLQDEEMPHLKFDVILAADVVYSLDHPRPLTNAIQYWLKNDRSSRVICELPRRNGFDVDLQEFKNEMARINLVLIEEAEDKGYDDWGSNDGDGDDDDDDDAMVRCWYSVWTWSEK